MSMFSRIVFGQIQWDKADPQQKLEELAKLPPEDPILAQLAVHDADEPVRHKAMERMEAAALWALAGSVRAGDEDCLAACLEKHCGEDIMASGDLPGPARAAPAALRIALIGHARNEAFALALVTTLDDDAGRARAVRSNGLVSARVAAARAIGDIDLLETLALEFRDKQRYIYRAARDHADELLALRESCRRAQAVCEQLEGLLERNELTLTTVVNAEREYQALLPAHPPAEGEFPQLQARYAAVLARARQLLQDRAETWRDAERLKAAIAGLAERSSADAAVEPDALAALVAEREAMAAKIADAAFEALAKEREHMLEALARLTERHAVLGIESKALAAAGKLVDELRADQALLTPAWRAELARAMDIVRPSLRGPLEEAAHAVIGAIEAVAHRQADAERAAGQQFRGEIEALVKQMEQHLDKGQHQQAGELTEVLKAKRAAAGDSRPLPAALEFRIKRCQDRLAKMTDWKRFGDVQAREALCREAEALAKRVGRQEKSAAADGQGPQDAAPAQPCFPWPVSPRLAEAEATAKAADQPAEDTPAEAAQTPVAEQTPAAEQPPIAEQPPVTEQQPIAEQPPAADEPPVVDKTPVADQPHLSAEEIAKAVRELQTRWQQLDAGKGASTRGLWQRFRRACDRAYAPARKHFEALEQQRSENAEKKNAVLDRIAALNGRIVDGAEWGRILSERGELIKAWFEAGALPRKDARAMQKRFDTLTAEIDAKLDARRETERVRRRALIDQAKAIAERPADGGSMAAMIALQKQWQEGMKGAIRLKAREDQTLWEAFRAAGSALFGKRDAEKAARNAERDAQSAERNGLIREMQALAAQEDTVAIRRGMDDIGARWQAMAWPERRPVRDLEQKFSTARAAASARITAIRGEAENRQRAAALARLAVVERAEQALGGDNAPDIDAVRAEVQGMLGEGEKLDARVIARLDALAAAIKAGPEAWRAQADKTQAERDALLLELEIVLNLPSPPELESARRMRMLKRLAESKNARSTPPLMAPDVPKAVDRLLGLPMAMQGAQARVEAVIKAAGHARK